MRVRIDIGAMIRVERRLYSERLIEHLKRSLTVDNPAWLRAKSQGRRVSDSRRYIRLYIEEDDGSLLCPRGFMLRLRRIAKRLGKRTQLNSNVVTRGSWDESRLPESIELRDYQIEAVQTMRRRVQGMIEIPTGGGKTFTGAAAIVVSGEPAIILVHTEDLVDQWLGAFRALGVNPRVIGAGAFQDRSALRDGEVAIAMVQTLSNIDRWREVIDSAGFLIIDEAHHVVAENWQAVVNASPARFRWGLSATMVRSDGLAELFEYLVGRIEYRVTLDDLVSRGYLKSPMVVPVNVDWAPGPDHYPWEGACPGCGKLQSVDMSKVTKGLHDCPSCDYRWEENVHCMRGHLQYSRALTAYMTSDAYIDTIRQLVIEGDAADRAMLVLTGRKRAVRDVAAAIRRAGVNAEGMMSGMGKSARARVLERFRAHELHVIVATSLADEGLDLPRADMLVNAAAGKFSGVLKQRVGRVLRPDGKDPLVFDLVGRGSTFRRQWGSRRSTYVKTWKRRCLLESRPVSVEQAIEHLQQHSLL